MSFTPEGDSSETAADLLSSSLKPEAKPAAKRIDKRRGRKRKPRGGANGRPAGVKATGLRAKAWRSMRHLQYAGGKFTLNDLLDINATGSEKSAHSNLAGYLVILERHAVVQRLARRAGDTLHSPGFVVWRLAQDLGWDAPVWRNVQKVLWNPNTQTVVPLPDVDSDTADKGHAQ